MIPVIAGIEAGVLAGMAIWLAWRMPAREASATRLAAIAGLLVAQALVAALFVFALLPAAWRPGLGIAPLLLWFFGATRAALVLWAFTLWFSISRQNLSRGWAGLLALAFIAGVFDVGFPSLAATAFLLWLTGRSGWTQSLAGARRVTLLFGSLLLLLLLSAWPQGVVREGLPHARWVPLFAAAGGPLLVGDMPARFADGLTLARPLDRLTSALLQLFRAQLLVLLIRAITLPIHLYGMSLRRRFLVNYILIRSIPSILASLTLLLVIYFAIGVSQATRAREAFERTLARADASAQALLLDPRLTRSGPEAGAVLESARAWLGPAGASAHVVLHGAAGAPVATAGTPPALLEGHAATDQPRGPWRGTIEADSVIYLIAHRVGVPDTSRSLDVFVPLDSTVLSQVARSIGVRINLGIQPEFSPSGEPMRIPDLTRRPRVTVAGSSAPAGERSLFLGRTYLPLGPWAGVAASERAGALVLELRGTRSLLVSSLARVTGWLFSNSLMLVLLVLLIAVIGVIEGLAVRTGRKVVRSIEEEVGSLREAATRFGKGQLAHRIPVRGQDELSALAGSFNEMAASLELQRRELIEKERLDEDLAVALAIQRRFLPQRPPEVAGLDVAGISVPSREVGGDLFHYLELPGGRLAVALGDVSGKSVPAALIMSNVMAALRAEVQHEAEVERSMERVNRLLAEQIEPGRFVTLFYGIVDPAAGRLRYTSAGHNPALRIAASGEVSWLREGGVPLGVAADSRYPAADCPLEQGDLLVVYSDGVTEAEGRDGTGPMAGRPPLFGEPRLVEAAGAARTRPAAAVVEALLAAVKAFAGDRPQADDITLVVVRRT
jgi:serine phosphatase RsbU (regulator of sigma subunit)